MSNNSKKISELPIINSALSNDRIVILKNPNSAPATVTISVSNLLGNSSANLVIQEVNVPNSSITVKKGTIFYDQDYLYIAVANNTIKRINLSSF